MKKAPIALFFLSALLFWAKAASAQAVPESCVVTEKATGKSDTLRLGTELRVKATKVNGSSAFFKQPLVFWHADSLELGPSGKSPEVFLPVEEIQYIKWRSVERPGRRQCRKFGFSAIVAGLTAMVVGTVVHANDNCLFKGPAGCNDGRGYNSRGEKIVLTGTVVFVSGIPISILNRRRSRTAYEPATDWLVSPLGRRR